MSLKRYKIVDILVFVALAFIFELLNYYASTKLDDFKLVFLSYSVVLSIICVYRWGLIGTIVSFAGGIGACIAASNLTLPQYVAYGFGNLLGVFLPSILFLKVIGRKIMDKQKWITFSYFVLSFILVIVFRCLIVGFFEINNFGSIFLNSLKNQIIMQSMSFVISALILVVANRKNGDMLVEMVSYIKNVQDRQKLGGLKEIKESPKFNFDKPLTEPDEMDEAYILDGGQLSNKELKELDAVMYEDVDEEADPLDILTSNQEEKEGL